MLDGMDLNLKDKTAVVTGASRGIGLAIAAELAAEGTRVTAGARTDSAELARLREKYDVHFVAADLATPAGPVELIDEAVSTYGGIDVLVNNVALSEAAGSVIDFTDEQWQRIFDATLFSAVRTVRASVPHMKGRSGPTIINISSLNAKLASGVLAPYSAAKAALTNFTKALAEDLGPQGIRVNAVSPGPVRTPMWTGPGGFAHLFADQAGTTVDDVMDRLLPESMAITSGRVTEPEEIAALVLFLASERSANIIGADYIIDGGMYKSAA
jgi:NAD(P)-dependent dehydrogenase (short-subunit alcohol dehydrogenase family)